MLIIVSSNLLSCPFLSPHEPFCNVIFVQLKCLKLNSSGEFLDLNLSLLSRKFKTVYID